MTERLQDLIDLHAFRSIMAHLTSITGGSRPEGRKREQKRCRLAIRRIKKWQEEGREIYDIKVCRNSNR